MTCWLHETAPQTWAGAPLPMEACVLRMLCGAHARMWAQHSMRLTIAAQLLLDLHKVRSSHNAHGDMLQGHRSRTRASCQRSRTSRQPGTMHAPIQPYLTKRLQEIQHVLGGLLRCANAGEHGWPCPVTRLIFRHFRQDHRPCEARSRSHQRRTERSCEGEEPLW